MSAAGWTPQLERLRELPSLPQVVLDLQAALAREDVSLDTVAETVSHDQALAAKTLRIANCSFYGVPSRIVSIRQAIGVLGLRSVSTLLVAAAVSDRFPRIVCAGFDLERYWRHSVAVALCAREIARLVRIDTDAAFTAGLLHDLGRLALASQLPESLKRVYARRSERDARCWTLSVSSSGRIMPISAARSGHVGTSVARLSMLCDCIMNLRSPRRPPSSTSSMSPTVSLMHWT